MVSVYSAEPFSGWFGTVANPGTSPNITLYFTGKQQRSLYVYGKDPSVTAAQLGTRPSTAQLSFAEFATFAATSPNEPAFVSPQTNPSIGILGTIPTRYWLNFSLVNGAFSGNGYQPVPLYNYVSQTANDLDDTISTAITTAINQIASLDKSILLKTNANRTALNVFYLSLEEYLKGLPHGGVYFNKVDHDNKAYEWTMHIGYDKRLTSSTSFPTMGLRQLFQQTALDNAVLRTGNVAGLGLDTITQGFRAFPQLQSTKIEIPFDGLIGQILYPQGISFLLTVGVATFSS